jgi:hypothetical protein
LGDKEACIQQYLDADTLVLWNFSMPADKTLERELMGNGLRMVEDKFL